VGLHARDHVARAEAREAARVTPGARESRRGRAAAPGRGRAGGPRGAPLGAREGGRGGRAGRRQEPWGSATEGPRGARAGRPRGGRKQGGGGEEREGEGRGGERSSPRGPNPAITVSKILVTTGRERGGGEEVAARES
jgi:hypothetical protein